MNKRKSILLGIILIGISILIAFWGYKRMKYQDKIDQEVTNVELGEKKQEKVYEKKSLFIVKGLSSEIMHLLEVKEEEIADFLHEWTYYNGFSKAREASFYPEIVLNMDEQTFTMECQLDDEDQTILIVKYEKQRKSWSAHL